MKNNEINAPNHTPVNYLYNKWISSITITDDFHLFVQYLYKMHTQMPNVSVIPNNKGQIESTHSWEKYWEVKRPKGKQCCFFLFIYSGFILWWILLNIFPLYCKYVDILLCKYSTAFSNGKDWENTTGGKDWENTTASYLWRYNPAIFLY